MPDLPRSSALLRQVATRIRLVSIGRGSFIALLIVAGLFVIWVAIQRFTGLLPVYFDETIKLLLIPAAAVVLGLLFHRRPKVSDAARAVDMHSGTKDLYLTLSKIENAAGEYKSLVAADAERRAGQIKAVNVIPMFGDGRKATYGLVSAVCVALILFGGVFIPTGLVDPFGVVEAATEKDLAEKELLASKKATAIRKAQLKKKSEGRDELSKDVKKAIEQLKSDFRNMKKKGSDGTDNRDGNNRTLGIRKKLIEKKWLSLSAKKLKDLFDQTTTSQRFGGAEDEKLKEWTKELQQGSTESIEKELEEMKNDLERLLQEKDPVKKAELKRQLKRKLKDLEEFATEKANSKPLAAALKQAMKQLEMTNFDKLESKALDALKEQLDLTKLELKEIAQSAKDLKKLEEALEAIQNAKQANAEDTLDGEDVAECQTLDDYAALYKELMGEEGEQGEGTGGEGFGEGGEAPEDDSAETGFKTEISKSAIVAGKVLLQMKTKGLSDSGDVVKRYSNGIAKVKQGAAEAMLSEQIPPGYHKGIKGYFNNIEETLKKSKAKGPKAAKAEATK